MPTYHIVDQAITTRHSVRAFLNTAIEPEIIKDILSVASRAPSGNNIQPWKVYVVTGQKRQALIDQVCAAQGQIFSDPAQAEHYQETFAYYPQQWSSPFIERRRENGWALYGLLGIEKGQHDKMQAQLLRNYQLFDAPVGLFFTLDKSLSTGSKMDIAMMIQNVMITAKARGIDSCPQAAWNPFHKVVFEVLGISDDEELVCCIALGYADSSERVNQLKTPRVEVEAFTTFLD